MVSFHVRQGQRGEGEGPRRRGDGDGAGGGGGAGQELLWDGTMPNPAWLHKQTETAPLSAPETRRKWGAHRSGCQRSPVVLIPVDYGAPSHQPLACVLRTLERTVAAEFDPNECGRGVQYNQWTRP